MEVKIPTEINDITVAEYQKYSAIDFEKQDDDFAAFKLIEIFCGVPLDVVSKFPLKDAEDIAIQINGVLSQTCEFTNRFTLNGVEYGFIPSLEDMTLGEYINLEEFLSDPKTLNRAAAVMYRPITRKFGKLYEIQPYTADKDQWDVMKQAPIGIISEAVVFFYRLGKELLLRSMSYLQDQEQKTIIREKLSSVLNTDGLIQSTLWQEATLLDSIKLRKQMPL